MKFTIENSDFLNLFYSKLQEYCGTIFVGITYKLNKNGYWNFDRDELLGLILLNKTIFQKVKAYFDLVDNNLALAETAEKVTILNRSVYQI
ncbi:hypothetical protein AAK706_13015 [Erysipelotrichaceae bacterium 66-17]|nr:hypothetical protein EROP_12750 [Erysipelotrichaceae bacterium OPF54]